MILFEIFYLIPVLWQHFYSMALCSKITQRFVSKTDIGYFHDCESCKKHCLEDKKCNYLYIYIMLAVYKF